MLKLSMIYSVALLSVGIIEEIKEGNNKFTKRKYKQRLIKWWEDSEMLKKQWHPK